MMPFYKNASGQIVEDDSGRLDKIARWERIDDADVPLVTASSSPDTKPRQEPGDEGTSAIHSEVGPTVADQANAADEASIVVDHVLAHPDGDTPLSVGDTDEEIKTGVADDESKSLSDRQAEVAEALDEQAEAIRDHKTAARAAQQRVDVDEVEPAPAVAPRQTRSPKAKAESAKAVAEEDE